MDLQHKLLGWPDVAVTSIIKKNAHQPPNTCTYVYTVIVTRMMKNYKFEGE